MAISRTREGAIHALVLDEEEKSPDPRNLLNDLTGAEWLPETKSFFFQKGLGSKHPHAQFEKLHPAPFSYQDIQRLVLFFTKRGQRVLDPFSGIGSTAKACALNERRSVNIELSAEFNELAIARLDQEVENWNPAHHQFINNDVRIGLTQLEAESVHFIVTSPPYWSILNKKPDHKALERVRQDLRTTYSDDMRDLGNITDYNDFLQELTSVFVNCMRVLKTKRYMALVVSDFRHKNKFYPFHADLLNAILTRGAIDGSAVSLQGVKALFQNHKSLKPYGYPFAYVENVHHQYILIFRKEASI